MNSNFRGQVSVGNLELFAAATGGAHIAVFVFSRRDVASSRDAQIAGKGQSLRGARAPYAYSRQPSVRATTVQTYEYVRIPRIVAGGVVQMIVA